MEDKDGRARKNARTPYKPQGRGLQPFNIALIMRRSGQWAGCADRGTRESATCPLRIVNIMGKCLVYKNG